MQAVNVVYHSGAVMAWGLDMAAARQTNLHGAMQLLRLTHQHLSLTRFVQVSGFLVMLPNYLRDLGIDADGRNTDWPAVYKDVGGYEASKLETHFAIKHLAAELGVPLTVIHPSLVIGHSQSGEISLTQDYAKTVGNLLQRKLPLVPRGAIPMIAVDELTAFMARIIDVPEAIGQEYVLASSDTRSLKDTLTICAQTAHVPAPYGTLPMGVFKALSQIGWLARLLEIEAETLSFIRSERPDLTQTHAMQQQLGLSLAPLTHTLQHTTRYLLAERRAKNSAHPADGGTHRAWSRSSV
jgi:thioester reductase-like protein